MREIPTKPLLLAVDEDAEALARVERELDRRYGTDYRVVCLPSAATATAVLAGARAAREEVALVLADQGLEGMTGEDFLARVPEFVPSAKRALLVSWGAWGDRPSADVIVGAMARGHIDDYVVKPRRSPDEQFHHTVAEFIHEWWERDASTPSDAVIVGERWSRRSHEVTGALSRSGIPHTFYTADSPQGASLLEGMHHEDGSLPVVMLTDGHVLVDPSDAELAAGLGMSTRLVAHDFDVIIVGAGPGGLAAGVYASSEGLRTLVVEPGTIGGQAGSSSLIRNYLGFSRGVSGSSLAMRGYRQAWAFGTEFLFAEQVEEIRSGGGRHVLTMSGGSRVTARAVVLATGVSYRRLGVPPLEALTGAGVFYSASASEARALRGEPVYVVGGGNSAGQAAMHLSRYAARVTLAVRSESLDESMSRYLRDEIEATPNIEVRYGTEVVDGGGQGHLERLTLRARGTGELSTVDASALFLLLGARPRTEWLPEVIERDEQGYILTGAALTTPGGRSERWPLERAPLSLETSMPGVFAVGDVRSGAVKRVASAVGEGSIVVSEVHQHLAHTEPAAPPAAAAGTAAASTPHDALPEALSADERSADSSEL